MMTASGHPFEFDRVTLDDIKLEDLAHHLAQTNRFSGACKFPYSVAQHSWLMWSEAGRVDAPHQWRLDCLLHDAHEAYVGDQIKPLQWELQRSGNSAYEALKFKLDKLIRKKFNLLSQSSFCKTLDMRMLVTEREQLMMPGGPPWGFENQYELVPATIDYWPWRAARAQWFEAVRFELARQ